MRGSEAAELEIRRLAVALVRLLQDAAPAFFSDFEIYEGTDRREAARVLHSKV
jgi:thymidylate synthase (FAD)